MKALALLGMLACMALGIEACAAEVAVTDDRGVMLRLHAPPQRIVSMLPSLTETVCELGGCAQLVGVDRYSNHPASLQALPKVGGLDDANVEAVVALKPDVVLVAMSSRVTDRLEALGLKVMALEPRSQDDMHHVALKLGQLLGKPEAGERMWSRVQEQINAAAHSVPSQARGWKVYYEVDSAPYAASEASFIGALLKRLGLVNVVPGSLGPFPKLNPEYVVLADPQLIMVSARNLDGLTTRPGWAGIRAVKDQRLCAFTPAQRDVLSRPGPRLGEAAQFMAACLRKLAAPTPGKSP